MGISAEIISDLKSELDSKKRQRQGVLDQLKIIDVLIDKYDEIIINIDKASLPYIETINSSITPVKSAYDARIESNCRSDLKWVELVDREFTVVDYILSGGNPYNIKVYEVQKDDSTYDFIGYHGAKYYRKPSNRDYGSQIIDEFNGNVSIGSSIISINVEDGDIFGVPSTIKIGDIIVDNLDSPEIFKIGALPQVTGFGTTQTIGIITSVTGGIATMSYSFAHFGAGSISGVTTGMYLINVGILTDNSKIVGFGTTAYPIQFYDEVGILTSTNIDCTTLILDKPSLSYLEEGKFYVGVLTEFPAVFISTTSNQTKDYVNFTAIRSNDNIDENFDYTRNPNSPLKIGTIDATTLGIGHSVYYNKSGDPEGVQKWRPETGRDKVNVKGADDIPAVKEPKVGAGRAGYYEGNYSWPITIKANTIQSQNGPVVTSYSITYAKEGDTVMIGGIESVSIGTTNVPFGGFPQNCSILDSNITTAETNMNYVVSVNIDKAKQLVNSSKVLRSQRERKENYAWSLLQAASSLREDIDKLEMEIKELEDMNFTPFET